MSEKAHKQITRRCAAFILACTIVLGLPGSAEAEAADMTVEASQAICALEPLPVSPEVPGGASEIAEVIVPVPNYSGRPISVIRPVPSASHHPAAKPIDATPDQPHNPSDQEPGIAAPPEAGVLPEAERLTGLQSPFKEKIEATAAPEALPYSRALVPIEIPAGTPVQRAPLQGGVIVVDSDVEQTPKNKKPAWRPLEDAPERVQIAAGTKFPVSMVSSITSKHAKVGDRVEARLKVDLVIGSRVVAPKGSLVVGEVTKAHKARRLLIAEIGPKRWMRANGALGLRFNEIQTEQRKLKLSAVPATMPRIVNNKNEGRILGVNKKGEIASPLSIQLKHQGIHLAIRAASSAGGVFSMGALPVAFGVMGAIDPSFAFMHPVGKNVRHRRLKGFAMGALSGLPGGFIIADFLIRGVESTLLPGDEFLLEFKQDFTDGAQGSV